MCNPYEDELIAHIHHLQAHIDSIEDDNTKLYRENKSYKLWMERSIDRVKQMQN